MSKRKLVDFAAVKAAVTLEQVLDHYGLTSQMKRGSDSLCGKCPIHQGENPTEFRVSLSKNCWNCFSSCHCGGNVIDFVAKMENVSFRKAAELLAEWFRLDVEWQQGDSPPEEVPIRHNSKTKPPATPSRVPEKPKPNVPLKFKLEKLQHEHPYLVERGITLATAIDFGVGYCEKGIMAGYIAIPIHNAGGQVMAYCGRWPGEPSEDTPKYKQPKGFFKSQELFNLDRAIKEPPDHPLVIVEGFFDAMKLHQQGVKKVVALMGSTLAPEQEALIRKNTNSHSHVIVMLDEDDAGRAGREQVVQRLAAFVFVKAHAFAQEGQQPEHLTAAELAEVAI